MTAMITTPVTKIPSINPILLYLQAINDASMASVNLPAACSELTYQYYNNYNKTIILKQLTRSEYISATSGKHVHQNKSKFIVENTR